MTALASIAEDLEARPSNASAFKEKNSVTSMSLTMANLPNKVESLGDSGTNVNGVEGLKMSLASAVEVIARDHSRFVKSHAVLLDEIKNVQMRLVDVTEATNSRESSGSHESINGSLPEDDAIPQKHPAVTPPNCSLSQARFPSETRKSEMEEGVPSANKLHEHISHALERKPKSPKIKTVSIAQDFAMAQGWVKRLEHREEPSTRLSRCVRSTVFDIASATIILLNAAFLAVSTNYAAQHNIGHQDDLPIFFKVADNVFASCFFIELVLRMVGNGPVEFLNCCKRGWLWNYFDLVIVSLDVVDIIRLLTKQDSSNSNLSALRMLRALRISRAVRVLRLVKFFKELRLMVLSVLHSFVTLLWALMLLCILIFIFSIFLMQNVNNYLYEDSFAAERDPEGKLTDFFGSIGNCVYTLFVAVTGGRSWQEISDPLFSFSTTAGLMFCFYIFFTVFAMLNIITGIFLETAMSACKSDQDEVIAEQIGAEDSSIKTMQKVFVEADSDGNGIISAEEFDAHLSDPRMRAYLGSIGIETGEAEGLFRLLDLDNSGSVTVDEFIFGCMRLKGQAKAVDVATLLYENKRMFKKWNVLTSFLENQFRRLNDFEQRIEVFLQEAQSATPRRRRHSCTEEAI